MLQRLPVAALNKTGTFSASRTAPLRAAQRLSSVGTNFGALSPRFGLWSVFMIMAHSGSGSRLLALRLPTHSRFVTPTTLRGTCLIDDATVTGVLPNNPRFRDALCNRFDRLVHPLVRNPSFYRRGPRVLSRRGRSPPSHAPMATQGLVGLVRPCQVTRPSFNPEKLRTLTERRVTASGEVTSSTRRFAPRATRSTALPGVIWSVCRTPRMRSRRWQRRSSILTAPTTKARCSNAQASSRITCPRLTPTKRPPVPLTKALSLLTLA